MTQVIGQRILADNEIGSVIIWSLMIAVLIVIGYMGVTWVRKWLSDTEPGPTAGFTLGDLRELHKSGKMSDEEFERAKLKVVEAAKKAAAKQAQPKKPPQVPPGMTR